MKIKNKRYQKVLIGFSIIFLYFLIGAYTSNQYCASQINHRKHIHITNPYEGVDWQAVNHVKTALHTHTANSGIFRDEPGPDSGGTLPDDFIKAYEKAGFGALVLTDHDYIGYPWDGTTLEPPLDSEHAPPSFVNSPNSSLLTVPGNELSKHTHLLSYGTMYRDDVGSGFEENIVNVAGAPNVFDGTGGIIYLAHPRRNNASEDRRNEPLGGKQFSDAWWADLVLRHDHIKGMEVLNAGRFSRNHSERLWDAMLTQTMPERNIFGIATDDNHNSTSFKPTSKLGGGYTYMLLHDHEMTNYGLWNALSSGVMYFSTHKVVNHIDGPNDDKKPRPNTPPPKIDAIDVDHDKGTITVTANYTSKIDWISGVNADNTASRVVYSKLNNADLTGTSAELFTTVFDVRSLFDMSGERASYVRFRLFGHGGQTHAQAFGLNVE